MSIDSLGFGDSTVVVSESVRSIGGNLDCGLTMDKQISSLCRSAWCYLHQIGKIRKYLTLEQTKTVVHAHVTSRLDQNNSLLIGLPKEKLRRLQRVQNAAARLIAQVKKRDHITPILIQLHWLPIDQRVLVLYKVLLIVFKCRIGQGPEYLDELLAPYVPLRELRIGSENILCVPEGHYVNTKKRAFGIRGPAEWNNLPRHLRMKESIYSFKSSLKTYLFKLAYE